jgi:pilin isopeptide linkage protein
MKKTRKFLALLTALVLVVTLAPAPANGEDLGTNADKNTYTVVLRYDDNIQLRYQHKEVGIDGYWVGVGDVPLGGATLNGVPVIPQLYCVDAQARFHSYAVDGMDGSTGGGSYAYDTVPNYVAVSPENLPAHLQGHWNELSWLVVNGYSDEASLKDLNARYSGDNKLSDGYGDLPAITYDVAVMATKAAVWHYTNPDVAYLSTNFLAKSNGNPNSANGIKHRQFVALMGALVRDANAYAANPNVETLYDYDASFKLAIDDDQSTTGAGLDFKGNPGIFHGPFYVRAKGGVVADGDKVFLEMEESPYSGSISFYFGEAPSDGDSKTDIIPGEQWRYGAATSDTGPGVEVNETFYIFAEPGTSVNGMSITAFARAAVQVNKMPVVLVHQNPDGSQDWGEVQAFIGLAAGQTTVYGTAALPLSSEGTGSITLFKTIDIGADPGPYLFRLTDSKGNPVYLGDTSILPLTPSPIQNGLGEDGILSLDAGGSIAIGNLPYGDYVITELRTGAGAASYRIGGVGSPVFNRAAPVSLAAPGSSAMIFFTNHPAPPTVSLEKLSSAGEGNHPLTNAVFQLTKDGSPNVYDSGEIPTDIAGKITFPALPAYPNFAGNHTLTEVSAPANHTGLSGPISIEVDMYGMVTSIAPTNTNDEALISKKELGRAATITVINEHIEPASPKILLRKFGGAGGNQALANVRFRLTNSHLDYDEEFTTDTSGEIEFYNLPPSDSPKETYTLTETAAPSDHHELAGSIDIEVDIGGTVTDVIPADADISRVEWSNAPGAPATITVTDAYITTVSLRKLDDADRTKFLPGAVFCLTNSDPAYDSKELTTDSNGEITFPDLPAPDSPETYTLTEIAAPPGYDKLSGPISIKVEIDGTISKITPASSKDKVESSNPSGHDATITVLNAPDDTTNPQPPTPPTVSLKKLGGADGSQALANVRFRLANSNLIPAYAKERTTDSNGEITFSDLPDSDFAGAYTLTEIAAPPDHDELEGSISIEVETDGTVSKIEAKNRSDDNPIEIKDITLGRDAAFTVINEHNPTDTPPPSPPTPSDSHTPASPSATVQARKLVGVDTAEQFAFTLTQLNSADADDVKAGGITRAARTSGALTEGRAQAVSFEAIRNLAAGVYYFRVTENAGTAAGWTYDDARFVVRVDVSAANAVVTYPDGEPPTFTNAYTSEGGGGTPPEDSPTEDSHISDDSPPQDASEGSSFYDLTDRNLPRTGYTLPQTEYTGLWIALCALVAAGLGLYLLRSRRHAYRKMRS